MNTNLIAVLGLGIFGGIILENPEKRKKVITLINKTGQSVQGVVSELIPKGGVTLESEKLQATTGEYK